MIRVFDKPGSVGLGGMSNVGQARIYNCLFGGDFNRHDQVWGGDRALLRRIARRRNTDPNVDSGTELGRASCHEELARSKAAVTKLRST